MKLGTLTSDQSYVSDLFQNIPKLEVVALDVRKGRTPQAAIDELEQSSVRVILATENFDVGSVAHRVPLISPRSVLQRFVAAVDAGRPLGVISAVQGSSAATAASWQKAGVQTVGVAEVVPGSGPDVFAGAALKLKSAGAELIVLESMAFSVQEKRLVRAVSETPVISARSAVAAVVNELYGSDEEPRDLMGENTALAG